MKKSIIITGIILVILFIIISTALVLSTSVDDAFISHLEGDVQIENNGKSHQATLGEKLSRNDIVKTGASSIATIVLHESIIINLEQNTQAKIESLAKDSVKIIQKTGITWNKFLKLNGVTSYEVETPNTVATVRGTEFGVSLKEILIAEGELELKTFNQLYELKPPKAMTIDGEEVNIQDATPEQREYMKKQIAKTRDHLIELRQREIDKNGALVQMMKKTFGATQDDMMQLMYDIDEGKKDPEDVYEKSPVKTDSVKRAVEISNHIYKQNQLLKQFE